MTMKRTGAFRLVLLALLCVDCLCLSLLLGERSAEALNGATPLIVALGDSYSSGEGTEPFFGQNGSNKYEDPDWLAHRSEKAWSGKLKVEGQGVKKDESWIFRASSGAETKHVTTDAQHKDWKHTDRSLSVVGWSTSGGKDLDPQLKPADDGERAALEASLEKADYVTMSIGGNDLGFAGIIEACFWNAGKVQGGGVEEKLKTGIEKYRSTTKDDLVSTYKAVLSKTGGDTTLLVVGYPHLSDGVRFMINADEARAINDAVDTFASETEALVRQSGLSNTEFVDVRGYFAGHENSYINDITLGAQAQELDDSAVSSSYSMHPNASGQEAYARAVQARIDELEHRASQTTHPAASVGSDVSMAIVMDVSGSMDDASALGGMSKLSSAKRQCSDFVSKSVRATGDASNGGMSVKVGLATFSSTSSVVCGLTNSVDDLTDAIDGLETIGRTNIYAGLDEGIKLLEGQDGPKVMVFLSDGLSNEGPDYDQIIELANKAKDEDIKVYTIGFGPSYELDEDLLSTIATITGGTYEHEDSSDIESAAVGLFATMMNAQLSATSTILANGTGTVQQDGTSEVGTFEVTGTGTVQAYLYWPGSVLDLQLTDPDGTLVGEGYPGLTIDTSQIPTSVTIQHAKLGLWKMAVYGREVSMTNEPYYAVAAFDEAAEPEAEAPVAGGGGVVNDGSGLMFLLLAVAAGCILGVYALSVRRR